LEKAVLPISVVILVALFLVQYRGTAKMGAVFGPICAAWFLVLGLLGLWEVLHNPGVLAAISPHWAITFCLHYKFAAFIAFGSVVLAVTGAEALYADMGHFGRRPIRWAWMVIVLPALVLNYLGQGALLLRDPAALENPFFLLAPEWFRLPLVFLATAATIIASQAMISGAYTIAWLHAAACGAPHQRYRRRPDLYAAGEYRPADRRADSGDDVPRFRTFGGSLWHCGNGHFCLHHIARYRCVSSEVWLAAACCAWRFPAVAGA
jgi:KUP system potassium uptake protein